MVIRHERDHNQDPDSVDDLVLLESNKIKEKEIVKVLSNRYRKDEIYTYIGPVLLSVNPFKEIRGMYSEKLMMEYYGHYKFEGKPHVFASAEDAHRELMSTGINQCVLISGESGAGKTEAAKKVMEYVSKVSTEDVTDPRASMQIKNANRTVHDIKESLLKSNPVLEAFGNAKTLRNDNSSRFGKYMEIQMDYNGAPLGGRISNYLLEKPRVVFQTKGERNFHIFYLLTNGMDSGNPMYNDLFLADSTQFKYCADPKSAKVKTIDDAAWFEEMDDAMATVGINGDLKMDLYATVAAILHLGNVSFVKAKKGGQDACEVSGASSESLKTAAKLMRVKKKQLAEALTTRSRETRIDSVKSPLTKVDECNKVRDALAKALYGRMFQRLVESINVTIHTDVSELSFGVLDIYGFEIFEHNSFEQLCINYCNEKLQQYFIQLTLKAEQEEYVREGIEWKDIKYFNNKVVCDLIESKRPPGIMAFLDEQITLGREDTDDLKYLNKMKNALSSNRYFEEASVKSKDSSSSFVIKHYAGDVEYSAVGMIAKNKDTLYRDILVLCGDKSKSEFINGMFPEGREKHDFKKPVTAGTQFVADMKDLIATLEKCEPHYIRCIKPNDKKRSNFFDDERVGHQVTYLGLLENVRVRRAGYAYRKEYDLFVRRYKMICSETWPVSRESDQKATEMILAEVGITAKEFKFGKTKVFVESPTSLFALEKKRAEAMHMVCTVVQRAFRNWRRRLRFQKLREVSVNLLHQKKRRNNSWVLYYLGDYINASGDANIQAALASAGGGTQVEFADHVDVHSFGKKHSVHQESLIITESAITLLPINWKPGKNEPRVFTPDLIQNITLSTFADDFIAINLKPKLTPKGKEILVASVVIECVRKSEVVTLIEEYLKPKVDLVFKDKFDVVVVPKKFGFMGLVSKARGREETVIFSETSAVSGRHAVVQDKILNKKNPEFDIANATTTRIAVSMKLGSQAELQLDDEIPERVIAHTAIGRQGKKRQRNRRRRY